jgi:hypothetical protein
VWAGRLNQETIEVESGGICGQRSCWRGGGDGVAVSALGSGEGDGGWSTGTATSMVVGVDSAWQQSYRCWDLSSGGERDDVCLDSGLERSAQPMKEGSGEQHSQRGSCRWGSTTMP